MIHEIWKQTNVFAQKQEGYFGVYVKVLTGDIPTDKARILVDGIRDHIADDIRITQDQNLLFKYVREESLPHIYNVLYDLGYARAGYDSTSDVTTCPGTDTCNLGISNSTGITRELERVIAAEYPELIYNKDITIKISGCINACGQHAMAAIGFHGSSMKIGKMVAPALQVLLGGGPTGDGTGVASEKIVKVPSKRGPQILRTLLDDYFENRLEGELYNSYYTRQGKIYFYDLLNPIAKSEDITPDDFIDWEHTEAYKPAIGIGECASVMIDLVATLLFEAEERIDWSREALEAGEYADSIYHSYTGFVNSAKALLVSEGLKTNTQAGIIRDFDAAFVETKKIALPGSFHDLVYQMNQQEPSKEFATYYFQQSELFNQQMKDFRNLQLA